MATLNSSVLTLLDWGKRIGPDSKVMKIVEILSQQNPMLDEMLWKEGNLVTGERTTIRTGLPTVYWRLLNQGIPSSKSTTAQVDENCGMLEAWSEVDKDLAELNGNAGAFRLSEAQPFLEAMNQEMAQTLFYGNSSTAQEEFNGLSIRYSSLSTSVANSQNIVSAGGAGSDNSSIYLIGWGENGVHGIFPKGSQAGIKHEDLGLVTVETTAGIAGNRMRAYQDHWQWKGGLVVKDWRQAVRIANIDISNLVAKSSAADLTELMIKAMHRIPNLSGSGKFVFYMNRSVFQMLDIQRRDDVGTGGGLDFNTVDGKLMYSFRGIPIRVTDALLETEAAIT